MCGCPTNWRPPASVKPGVAAPGGQAGEYGAFPPLAPVVPAIGGWQVGRRCARFDSGSRTWNRLNHRCAVMELLTCLERNRKRPTDVRDGRTGEQGQEGSRGKERRQHP